MLVRQKHSRHVSWWPGWGAAPRPCPPHRWLWTSWSMSAGLPVKKPKQVVGLCWFFVVCPIRCVSVCRSAHLVQFGLSAGEGEGEAHWKLFVLDVLLLHEVTQTVGNVAEKLKVQGIYFIQCLKLLVMSVVRTLPSFQSIIISTAMICDLRFSSSDESVWISPPSPSHIPLGVLLPGYEWSSCFINVCFIATSMVVVCVVCLLLFSRSIPDGVSNVLFFPSVVFLQQYFVCHCLLKYFPSTHMFLVQ